MIARQRCRAVLPPRGLLRLGDGGPGRRVQDLDPSVASSPPGYRCHGDLVAFLVGDPQREVVVLEQRDLGHRGRIVMDPAPTRQDAPVQLDRKSTRLNSSHVEISYAVFCLKKKKKKKQKKREKKKKKKKKEKKKKEKK